MEKTFSRQALYTRKLRKALIEKMGGRCVLCGQDDPDALEFDHRHGRDYRPNEKSSCARMALYTRENDAGLLRLLCGPCNLDERKRNDNGAFVATGTPVLLTMALVEVIEDL